MTVFVMEADEPYDFTLTEEEARHYTCLKPDLSMVMKIPLNTTEGLACLGGGLFQTGDLQKVRRGALDYTHAKHSLAWRGALFWAEFHPRSDTVGGTARASGVVVKVVDMSKSGASDGKGVFLGVVSPPYKNVRGHLKQNACILVDVAIDPIKIFSSTIPEQARRDLNALVENLPEFDGLGIKNVGGVATFFDQPSLTRFKIVERAVHNSASRCVQGTLKDKRKDMRARLDACYVPILKWYKANQMLLYRPLKHTVTLRVDQSKAKGQASKIVMQVSIAVMHIHSVHKLLLHKICAVHTLYAILHKIYALHKFCATWHGCVSIDGGRGG